jgi:hypothetical protein
MRHVPKIRISLLVLTALSAPALAADQLVAFDIVYTAEFYDGTVKGENYHHLVKPAPTEPASWTTPVDYSKGTVYIHQEVMTKPSARSTTITICFDGDLSAYGCITSKPYTTTGVHETVAPITSTWQYGQINWGKRRTEYHLALKDGAADNFPNAASRDMFVPSMMRIVMTVVPPGGTYVPPPPLGGGMPAADAGATPAADAGTPSAADAAPTASPDAAKVDPRPSPDAAASKPTPKPDAAAPPKTDPGEDPPSSNPPAAKSGGCSLGGGSVAGAALPFLVVGLLAALQRHRRRSP